MQSDRVRNRTFRDMFSGEVRYEIPFFQRGYAWEKKQWDQLFEDIIDDILPDINDGTPISDVEHFFGPIVVLEQADDANSFSRYLVIDGQQRITTVYLLLGLIKERLEKLQHKSGDALRYSLMLRELLTNSEATLDDYTRMKLFSTKGDRLPTYQTVFGSEHTPRSPHYHMDIHLYQPGHNQVDEFRNYCDRKFKHNFTDVPSLWQFACVLLEAFE